ncbi:hypothetical protein PR202_gb20717 [Eleusine coracana subsp. coracana]|uniref:Enhancer of polycomb-like protein n=1 Tax=Eleusine coracana subsp. coracana TaxID=191504 RepID=A0AAV5FC62_ELECO|nr:hypothetical protein PR202_gb20717 [Eleusine coracana subsp. coracana]
MLRKRDGKVPFRKRRPRRHFYEVSPHDVDPFCIVKERIRVFWPLDETWYFGLIKEYDPVTRLHHVRYDDKDEEWINIQNERIKLLLLPSEARNRSNHNNTRSVCNPNHEEREGENSDGSSARSSETEPISSWSPRPKQGRSATSSNISKQDETHTNIAPFFDQKQFQEPNVKGDKMFNGAIPDSLPANRSATALNNTRAAPEDMRFRFVYSRKRFCRKRNGFLNISEDSCPKIVADSAMVFAALPGRLPGTKDDASLTYVSLLLNLPLKPVYKFISEAYTIWLSNAFLLLQHGTLVALWPVVHLDILFVDNVFGLKHLLLETCLRSAVSFFCFLVGSFSQCLTQRSLKDSKIPCTSIRFQISGVHGKSQVVFMLFSFVEVGRSKWKHMLGKLQDHCSTRALSYADSKYTNIIMHHTNGIDRRVLPSIDAFSKGLDLWNTKFLKESNCSDMSPVICYFYERCQNDLNMATAPSPLLCQHLKLVTEGNLTNGSQQSISFTLDKDKQQSEEQHRSDTIHPSCPASGVCPLNLGSSSDGLLDMDTARSKNLSSSGNQEFSTAETTLSSEFYGSSIGDANPTCRKFPEQNGPSFGADKPCSSKLSVICSSQESGERHLSIKITQDKTVDASSDKSLNKDESDMHPISNLVEELNEYPIGRSTPTAPRTTYHRNRFTSISRIFGDGSKLLPEELTLTGFTGGSKRPRSQVSYSVSPRSEELGLKHKSHFRKIQPHNAAKTNDGKRFPDNSRSGHSSPESLTCVANVLVTVGDRGWREYDTQITMDSDGQSERRICVKACRRNQVGAEWCLEFPDRSQWSIFKQMHDECYSHNIRAASVKNIPIPGVCLVEDDDNVAVSFLRPEDYLGHVGTDVEIALNDSRVIYDMDSDDESWISSWRESLRENIAACKLTEDLFERVMDKLEKFAYSHNCNELTIDQMKEVDLDNVSLDIIEGIHAYWKDKRQKKRHATHSTFSVPFLVSGRRCNEYVGDGRTCEFYDSGSLYSPTGYSPRFSMKTDSPRSFDASERSLTPRYFRTNSSKRSASFAFSEDHQPSPSFRHQKAKRGPPDHWNNAIQEWQNTKHLFPGISQSHRVDIEELKLRDATSAAQHAATMAKLKREKAHCLMHKADLALHKATVALMMADAIKSSRDGRRDFRDDER